MPLGVLYTKRHLYAANLSKCPNWDLMFRVNKYISYVMDFMEIELNNAKIVEIHHTFKKVLRNLRFRRPITAEKY